jgi:hypothetical protein
MLLLGTAMAPLRFPQLFQSESVSRAQSGRFKTGRFVSSEIIGEIP